MLRRATFTWNTTGLHWQQKVTELLRFTNQNWESEPNLENTAPLKSRFTVVSAQSKNRTFTSIVTPQGNTTWNWIQGKGWHDRLPYATTIPTGPSNQVYLPSNNLVLSLATKQNAQNTEKTSHPQGWDWFSFHCPFRISWLGSWSYFLLYSWPGSPVLCCLDTTQRHLTSVWSNGLSRPILGQLDLACPLHLQGVSVYTEFYCWALWGGSTFRTKQLTQNLKIQNRAKERRKSNSHFVGPLNRY